MILDDIIQRTKMDLAQRRDKTPLPSGPNAVHPSPRGFASSLIQSKGPAVIAEIKRRSPSRGEIRPDLNPAEVAGAYEKNGARAISVLTDGPHFGGSLDDMKIARQATRLPILRKDFMVDAYQIYEAAAWEADAILLIVAALDDSTLRDFFQLATDLKMDVLVEVHDRRELDRAAALGARLIGVNNRNLKTMEVSLDTAVELAPHMPEGAFPVCESGLKTPTDLKRVWDVGYRAFLIGQALGESQDRDGLLGSLTRAIQ